MASWNGRWRFPLYLRIWLAVVVTVGVLTVAFGWFWRLTTEQGPPREIILRNQAGEVLGQTLSRPVWVPGQGMEIEVPSGLGQRVIIPALPDFYRRYPDIAMEMGCGDRPVHLIEEGVDCAVRGGALADSTLIARRATC